MSFSIVYVTCALLVGIVIGYCLMYIIHCMDAYIGEYKAEKRRRVVKPSEIKDIWKELNYINRRLDKRDELEDEEK